MTTVLKVWKPIVFIIGIALLVGFSIACIAAIIGFIAALPFAEYFVTGSKFVAYLGAMNVFVVAAVPALSLAFFIARLAFGKRLNNHWKAGLWSLWTLNLISISVIASTQARQFNRGSEITKIADLSVINSDTLVIDRLENPYADAMFSLGDLQLADNELVSYDVHLRVMQGDGENFELKQENISRGRDAQDANNRASLINYSYNIKNNTISLPRTFAISKETKWRGQRVYLILTVPVGKTIRFENNADNMVHRIDIDRDVERPWLDSDQYWVMKENGLVNNDWAKKNKMNEERDFKDFSKLQIEGKVKVIVEKGDNFKVSITGKEKHLSRVEAVQLEKTLSLSTDLKNPSSPIRVHIIMPSLQSLDIRNTDDVKIQGFVESKMRLKNDGSYDLKAFVNVDSLFLVQDGRGEINVRGNGKYLKADLNRRGTIDAKRFSVSSAEIKAQENSKAAVSVSDTIRINKDGSSRINIEGEPQLIEGDEENED